MFFDFFYLLLISIIPYRRKVVVMNLQRSFPQSDQKEIKYFRKRFYKYFTDLFAESVRNLFMKEDELKDRVKVINPEVIQQLYKKKKSMILLSSHYNNWELLITAQSLLFHHKAVGIGAPLSNKYWDKKITEKRERFGMKVVHGTNYKDELKKLGDEVTATLVLGDQSPGKDENCYWTQFLNQTTAFYFGAEFMANEFDMPVVSATIYQVRRGYYEVELKLITDKPRLEPYGFVTETYVRDLESTISVQPEFWLWSHKRWKKDVPLNLDEIKTIHRNKFVKRFRS